MCEVSKKILPSRFSCQLRDYLQTIVRVLRLNFENLLLKFRGFVNLCHSFFEHDSYMKHGIARGTLWLFLLCIFVEFVTTPFVQAGGLELQATTMISVNDEAVQLSFFLFEKTEEEVKQEKNDEDFFGIELIDLSEQAELISLACEPQSCRVHITHHVHSKLPLHKAFCVYLI